jgi:Fe-S oxidoreductase
MVTLEEEHSTRGRAHMLFELLQGEVVQGGWKDEHVKESLDLCLSCKACKSECPANVDMATYRAEFLAHYYEGRTRPLHAYAFGMVDRWLELASIAPGLANFTMQVPGLGHAVRRALHIAAERQLPTLAPVNFRKWAHRNGVRTVGAKSAVAGGTASASARHVILWVDTFNNHFHPETSHAALRVLQTAGFDVAIPAQRLCCGRPLYDFGLLDHAKQYLRTIMASLGETIDAGVPIVVLEPSCASVFRDELRSLFPNDARAARLSSQTVLLSELLESREVAYQPPRLARKVLLHGHCHHKAIMKLGPEESLLRRAGAEVQSPDAGCCGMAGAFGFEAGKYAVSQAIGERVLLPAVRNTAADTLIVSDGFSCREQIRQATGRKAIHLAEALHLGLPTQ